MVRRADEIKSTLVRTSVDRMYFMVQIRDRMLVILDLSQWDEWLDPEVHEQE